MNRPNSELVVCAWINSIAELTRSPNFCATELPSDNSTWGASGFVTVTVVGGTTDIYLTAGRPVVQLDAYAVKPSSSKPLWGRAHNLISGIVAATFDEATLRRTLNLSYRSADYGTAHLMECYPMGQPSRIYDDEGQYARVRQDMVFNWVGGPGHG